MGGKGGCEAEPRAPPMPKLSLEHSLRPQSPSGSLLPRLRPSLSSQQLPPLPPSCPGVGMVSPLFLGVGGDRGGASCLLSRCPLGLLSLSCSRQLHFSEQNAEA